MENHFSEYDLKLIKQYGDYTAHGKVGVIELRITKDIWSCVMSLSEAMAAIKRHLTGSYQ